MTDSDNQVMSAASKAAKLRSFKAKRTQIKSQCTRFRSYLNDLDTRNVTIVELRQRLQKFTENWDLFNSIQASIDELEHEPENLLAGDEERSAFERRYFEISSELEYLIESKSAETRQADQNTRHFRESTATQGSIVPNDHLKLPRVNLPSFSGSFEEWIPFRNIFLSMIDQNISLPNVQKMQYLLASLKGEARDVINALETSEDNYNEAWSMLLERYDDHGLIIQKHVKAIFELSIISKENHVALRRLIDNVLKHLRALKALRRPTDQWDDLMVHIITNRLDQRTNRAWETTLKKGDIPNTTQLLDFLAQHCRALEASERTQRPAAHQEKGHQEKNYQSKTTSSHVASIPSSCVYCGDKEHAIYRCKNYLQLEVQKRIKEARSRRLCLNCLKRASHQAKQCGSGSCRKCDKKHNTLLHYEQSTINKTDNSIDNAETSVEKAETVVATVTNCVSIERAKQVLLATATVKIRDCKGRDMICRALLDSGSQSCFITSECAQRLGLKRYSINVPICGLGETYSQARQRVEVQLSARVTSFKAKFDCLVVRQITQAMPSTRVNVHELKMPSGIDLADPEFYESSQIDLLIGAELFFDLMCMGKIKIARDQPIWQETLLGWIVTGNVMSSISKHRSGTVCNLSTNEQLYESIAKFWRIEQDERQVTRSPEERCCEDHFRRTYKRNDEDRFIVSLPMKNELIQKLGDSKETAMQRFKSLERKFERNPQLKRDNSEFMQEYLELQHMREVQGNDLEVDGHPRYYLPHHCVFKETSATTRLRVVFDASSKTTSNISLNQALMIGPVIQQDLFSILLRFRTFKYAVVADIAKMYRQILVNEKQTALQCVIWRNNPNDSIKTYELQTLTYGTSSASFLATRVLHELALLYEDRFPKGAAIVRRDFYMDDLISGANSLAEASAICQQAASLLSEGRFELRKWASNSEQLLRIISKTSINSEEFELGKESISSTLGIKWNCIEDVFQYTIKINSQAALSKRTILSNIARIFDPLGLLAPVLVTAKVIMQKLWKVEAKWDETLSGDILAEWTRYIENLIELEDFKIQRKVFEFETGIKVQLHGFCDASEQAYGGCVYLQAHSQKRATQVYLLCAKSKVAPIKTISIPRLELCGALLLSRLMSKVKAALELNIDRTCYWTDSSIVLHWIKATSKKLPVFVAHRVGEIQELSSADDWNHVGSRENPADLVSRGCTPKELLRSQLWWHGAAWLREPIEIEHSKALRDEEDEDDQETQAESTVLVTTQLQDKLIYRLTNKFSSLMKLIRITATCMRYIKLCRKICEVQRGEALTADELECARKCLIKMEQKEAFLREIETLQNGKLIANQSNLKALNPFLDSEGLLRVGGRLLHAELSYNTKHQLILPQRSKLSELIILHEHQRSLHSGADTTLAIVRQLYWPVKARGTVKRLIRQCIVCFKSKPRFSEQIMGSLPSERVTLIRPFASTGVDYCGPIYLREGKRRGTKRIKAYVAVFICMSTKAIHLEVASDLTTDSFLNAFKRFISRRGKPTDVFSDNGTNFIGANRELEELKVIFLQEQTKIVNKTAAEGIKWHFIPARSPHFGGIWEAAVKSFKRLFYKISSEVTMTFEEATTLSSQIEAILNSRSLTALSSDHNDLGYLSPGHFLIGDTMISYPEPDLSQEKINRLSRWQMLERMRQHFWKRWHLEYLVSLQSRSKWQNNKGPQLQVGQLVLIKEEGLPPLKWALGRVTETHSGADRVTRAASVKTISGVFKRPAAKLCILPLDD